ncbi:MAG: metal ABC transporter permease [Caldilineaceae bacterium]|nr:metal ABC transporter permease [Caldilineaceae bacterium]
MSASLEIQLIAVLTAAACALPGVFLVLRSMAMMADAISHTVLLGIVLVFFVVQDLQSPWLLVGAAATGLVTVTLVEMLSRTRLVREDAAIGLVFPALFSLAVILISRFARGVHLDVDAVLLGELAFAPFDRALILGLDLPKALVTMGAILLANIVFISVFYKELKLSTFDPALATALGFAPGLLHYGLMALVSITAVGAFDTVGAILVVALFITPAAAAYLLTDDLRRMLFLSVGIGVLSALSGYWLARTVDASIAGSMATMTGLVFVIVYVAAPQRGLVAQLRRRKRNRLEFAQAMLAIHLLNHEDKPDAADESRIDHLREHIRWAPDFAARVVRYAEQTGIVRQQAGQLRLTDAGRTLAQDAMVRA